jgi:low affinity Fe/Cu permease
MSLFLALIPIIYYIAIGVFIWLIFSTLVDISEQLKELNENLKCKEKKH